MKTGIDFTNAYCSTPTCIPARVTLLSGMSQRNTGIISYAEGADWNFPTLLRTAFSSRGYYSKAVGKMHVSSSRKLCGFHLIYLHDGYLHTTRNTEKKVRETFEFTDDYYRWLKQQVNYPIGLNDAGLDCNFWVARLFLFEAQLLTFEFAVRPA